MLGNSQGARQLESVGATPLDAAPARSPSLDEKVEKILREHDRTAMTQGEAASFASDAEWVAAAEGLYYMWPIGGTGWSWGEQLRDLSISRPRRIPGGRGVKICIVTVTLRSGEVHEIETGPNAARSLHKIWKSQR
jgi:hypothetical protein